MFADNNTYYKRFGSIYHLFFVKRVRILTKKFFISPTTPNNKETHKPAQYPRSECNGISRTSWKSNILVIIDQ